MKALASPSALANYQTQLEAVSDPPPEFASQLFRWLMGGAHRQNLVAWPFVSPPLAVIPVSMSRHLEATAFILPPGTGIPLHDHRGMHVLSVLLSGQLTVHSASPLEAAPPGLQASVPASTSAPAVKSVGDTWSLSPSSGNVHAFEHPSCGTEPAMVLEFLLPPYAPHAPCTYYQASQEQGNEGRWVEGGEVSLSPLPGHPLGLHMLGL